LHFSLRLILLNKLLEDGNTLYRRGRHEEAAHRYSYAVRRLPSADMKPGDNQQSQLFEQLRVHLLLNLSRCKRKMGANNEAVGLASEVLSFRPGCLDALHARARALRDDDRHEEALADLHECLRCVTSARTST